jgi:hypothetical protein
MTNGKLQQWKSMFLSLILLFGLASIEARVPAQSFDIVITNGRIIDGTGSPWYSGANTYAYTTRFNDFSAFIPAWAHDGGTAKLLERLKDPATRERLRKDMLTPSDQWDNEWQEIPGPEAVLIGSVIASSGSVAPRSAFPASQKSQELSE